ncbi:MAG: DNRLRE domain-containing protein [Deltaproteobacteria bacterium]|nr:DNRLRE domain-containing protein [Deltaproteobacteria bacterium]
MGRTKLILVGGLLMTFAAAERGEAATFTFTPAADAKVVSTYPTTNYASNTRIVVDALPATQSLIRFNVSGISGTVTRARVRLFVSDPSSDAAALYRTSSAWSETSVNWNTKPAPTGSAFGDITTAASGTWIEYSVTSAVTANGSYDFVLSGGSGDGSTYHSREASERPQLVIETTTTTEPPPPPPPLPPPPTGTGMTVNVTLQPRTGISGTQRVNFAVPFAKGQLLDPDNVRVLDGSSELRAARRELATHPDGSIRSVQIQVDVPVSIGKVLTVRANETPTTTALSMVAVSTTLASDSGPNVWARLPAAWLAASGVTGPQVTEASVEGTNLDAFDNVCDYQNHGVTQFISQQSAKDVWLYDRATLMYRGHARRGDQLTLESAYREAAIYRNGLTGTDASTRIGVPSAADDLKYHYTQGLALHYLMTGDDRFRESAEDVGQRIAALWTSPGYAGGSDFWTERHAGFALLGYVWARIVTDDLGAYFDGKSDAAVDAYLSMQQTYPATWTDLGARCFGHTDTSAGEDFAGTWGCSPWMSAILADGLDAYATDRGGTRATNAKSAIVKLGKIIARDGRDSTGKPYYWMGIGSVADDVDPYDEHWGEPAYVVAMAWHHGGRTDASLQSAATSMLAGLKSKASSPHMRSFNWQCRSAVATPYYLK